ncbi:XIAP-associated factor 1 [Boleophthalmus pectinirostris]|uniref:XIAP-associated factor 1 n=1 Tax=Boleophthalmus pectinirostris TaxID=150288 RepID=UPI00242F0DE3|nr:XIAP-associated factor 1 [Boleophthalmus pectinirostris]
MGDEEATRVCGRCKKEVAEANFALHESHCSRFLVVCPDCEENVPRSELQQHKQEQHAQVRCTKCKKKMERRLLPEHQEEECPERVEPCTFCELEMPWAQLQEHTVACGSRTELCPDCKRYVKLSDKEEHNRACSDQDLYNGPHSPPKGAQGPAKTTTTTTAPKLDVLCKVCKLTFPAEEIKRHEMRCTADSKQSFEDSSSDSDSNSDRDAGAHRNLQQMNFLMSKTRRGPSSWRYDEEEVEEDPNEHSTCPHCQLVLPRATLRWHMDKCKLHLHLKLRKGDV